MIGWWLACASWAGLDELDRLPADFPLKLDEPLGQITRQPQSGQVSVDLVRESLPDAERAFAALQAEARDAGFEETGRRTDRKRETVSLGSKSGRVELSCCARRSDGANLVFVSWFPPSTSQGDGQ